MLKYPSRYIDEDFFFKSVIYIKILRKQNNFPNQTCSVPAMIQLQSGSGPAQVRLEFGLGPARVQLGSGSSPAWVLLGLGSGQALHLLRILRFDCPFEFNFNSIVGKVTIKEIQTPIMKGTKLTPFHCIVIVDKCLVCWIPFQSPVIKEILLFCFTK